MQSPLLPPKPLLRNSGCMVFSTHGLPEVDNGATFTREEFAAFVHSNGIHHLMSAPPLMGWLREQCWLSKMHSGRTQGGDTLETQISRKLFLFHYHITPHYTIGVAPAKLLMGRRPPSHLDLLHPDMSERVTNRQTDQQESHDQWCHPQERSSGQMAWARSPATGHSWFPGTISKVLSQQRFQISLEDGHVVDWHIDHVRCRVVQSEGNQPRPFDIPVLPDLGLSKDNHKPSPGPPAKDTEPLPLSLHNSIRDRHPPKRFMWAGTRCIAKA